MPKSKSKIPDRWEAYSNIGEVIEGTKFITFKVPLREGIQVPPDMKFTPQMLMETLESSNLELGLVIDLTNTTRYYNRSDLESYGVTYEKIFVPGHVIPSDDIFGRFSYTVDSFLEEAENKDKLIGVHCTHGLNRTGYMVCRYMIEKLGIKPKKSIKAYGTARGYAIERENYLEDLKQRIPGKTTLGLNEDRTPDEPAGASNFIPFNRGRGNRRYNGHRNHGNPGNSRDSIFSNSQVHRGHHRDSRDDTEWSIYKGKKRRNEGNRHMHGHRGYYGNEQYYGFRENMSSNYGNHGYGYGGSYDMTYTSDSRQGNRDPTENPYNQRHRPPWENNSVNSYSDTKRWNKHSYPQGTQNTHRRFSDT